MDFFPRWRRTVSALAEGMRLRKAVSAERVQRALCAPLHTPHLLFLEKVGKKVRHARPAEIPLMPVLGLRGRISAWVVRGMDMPLGLDLLRCALILAPKGRGISASRATVAGDVGANWVC